MFAILTLPCRSCASGFRLPARRGAGNEPGNRARGTPDLADRIERTRGRLHLTGGAGRAARMTLVQPSRRPRARTLRRFHRRRAGLERGPRRARCARRWSRRRLGRSVSRDARNRRRPGRLDRSVARAGGSICRCGTTCAPTVSSLSRRLARRRIVCDGDPAAFVAPLPLELLEIDGGICEALRLLGVTPWANSPRCRTAVRPPLRRRGGGLARPRAASTTGRSNANARLRVDRMLYGEGEATSEEQVLFALRTLVGWWSTILRRGKRAGRLVLTSSAKMRRRACWTTRVAQPTAVPATLFDLLRARLEGVTLEHRSSVCVWRPKNSPRGGL